MKYVYYLMIIISILLYSLGIIIFAVRNEYKDKSFTYKYIILGFFDLYLLGYTFKELISYMR